MNHRNLHGTRGKQSRGFSTLELLLVMVVTLVIAAFAIPGFNEVKRTLRISGDARNLNGAINQAKMQAAANFTETRVYVNLAPHPIYCPNLATGCTFHVDVWNKAGNGGAGCWQVVGDANPCFIAGVSQVQILSPGVTYGFAGIAAPPPNTQTGGIAQGPGGFSCAPVNGKRVGQTATSACIQFNSRGIPININNGGVPTGNGALYITDNTQVYGITVGGTGLSQVWANNVQGNANWYRK